MSARTPLGSVRALAVLTLGLAGATAFAQDDQRWAYLRHYNEFVDCKRRLEDPRWRTGNRSFDALTPEQVLARCEGIALEVAADLQSPKMGPGEKTNSFQHLASLGRAGRPAVPAVLAALRDHENDAVDTTRVPYFCQAAEALGAADPKNPAVIRALTDALARYAGMRSTCHRCPCALRALARAGPEAAPIAGPVLEELAARQPPPLIATGELARTIQAMGVGSTMSGALLGSLGPPGPLETGAVPDERVARLRALAQDAAQLSPADREVLAETAAAQLKESYPPLRVAGAEALGRVGRLDLLAPALRDPHYEVRRAGLDALAAAGVKAWPFRSSAMDALNPFLGTAEAAAKALLAMGRGVAFEVELRGTQEPDHRPLFDAAARAAREGDLAPVHEVLGRAYEKGPHDRGFVRIDVLVPGRGARYNWKVHRIQVDVRGGVYGPGREQGKRIEGRLTAENTTSNRFFLALFGRQPGERLRILMSPEVAESPFTGSRSTGGLLPNGSAGEFEVEILKVCQPVIWEVFKGGGIIGPLRIETGCN